eukprot:GHUV01021874.1.p1 GENE.GHUV01021874.1~~GHUV01021874.1.p1  ORF type:complete len:152 (-),score=23.56 GHUV01021874.1:2482-2937(-)
MENAGSANDEGNVQARKQQQQKLGEDAGVARFGPAVTLESDTAAAGRRCDNSSCLAVEGVGVQSFKRCAACKQRWYCSAHCQVSPAPKRIQHQTPLTRSVSLSRPAGVCSRIAAASPCGRQAAAAYPQQDWTVPHSSSNDTNKPLKRTTWY